mmetsp:Transcript_30263/g.54802  ORF Transcript_30263/g.54802 Transcript_30263/m.54802 type:complete len:195 (-) Transcript_30263:215-799(-)
MPTMIEQLKNKFTGYQENKSPIVPLDNESVPPSIPIMPEDAFLKRNGVAYNSSVIPIDDTSVPPCQPAESSYLLNNSKRLHQTRQTRGKKCKENMRVFIPPGLEPAQRVKVRYPNGTTLRMVVPPRSKWLYKNCNGSIRSFFVVPVPADDPAQTTLQPASQYSHHSHSRRTQDKCRRPTKSIKKVHFSTQSDTV